MKTIKTTVYSFGELNEKAKDKAREWWIENDPLPFMPEYMQEEAYHILKQYNIEVDPDDVGAQYSLSYCQGDGAMIEFTGKWKKWNVEVKQSGRYCHYNSKTIDIKDNKGNYADVKTEDRFNEVYVKACQELERLGYAYIENAQSNEVVDDLLSINEYTFTSDGKRFG